ncbi:hypothetical protein [Allohahella sp. A8]|uniref:hypothetical protein n=1 Tax=Allohahella sp. A8 TaxID=3141461 RepID=UPI003A80EDB0
MSWQYLSDDEIIVDDCETTGPVSRTLAQFNDFDLSDEEVDPEDEAEEPAPYDICASGVERELFAVSDTHYRANLVCEGQRIGAMEMIQISTQPAFNHGTLSFAADSEGNFNASSGVCGSMLDGFGSEAHVGLIDIAAPYGDDARLELTVMTFSGLRTGVHEIGGGLVNGVTMNIFTDSFTDPNFFEGPMVMASGGTLTINTLDTYRVSGSFDMTTETGEKVQGNFDLNMR